MPPLRGHDSARKFHCEVQGCSASFVKRAHLRRHEMTHTQRRDFHCPGCNRAFSRNDSMSRHLRRKHPHLYRAHQNTSLDPSDVDHLHLPRLSTVVGMSTTVGNMASSSGTTLSSRPSPFEHHSNSPMQSRQDDHRSFGTQLMRPASTSDMYAHPGVLHTSQGLASGHSRASAAPQLSESPGSAQADTFRPYHRPDFAVKGEHDAFELAGLPPGVSGDSDAINRSYSTRRPTDAEAQMPRSDWAQYSETQAATSMPSRSGSLAAPHYRFPWERLDEEMPNAVPPGLEGWPTSGSGAATNSGIAQDPSRRDCFRMPSSQAVFEQAALPPGIPSMAEESHFDPQAAPDLLQSEFFTDVMRPPGHEEYGAGFETRAFASQASDRVRVEPSLNPYQSGSGGSYAGYDSQMSPQARSDAGVDNKFEMHLRSMCDAAPVVPPPSTGQLEQILTHLGLDLAGSQGSSSEAVRSNAPHVQGSVSESSLSAPPMIPSQDVARASWDPDRLAPIVPNVHLHPHSQAASSQNSFYLPSLTASQAEYLGPNATSHRRPLDRSISTASFPFDSGSQDRGPLIRAPGFAGAMDESIPEAAENSESDTAQQRAGSASTTANFLKPHDSFSSRTATWDEEGGRKDAQADAAPRNQTHDPMSGARCSGESEEMAQSPKHGREGDEVAGESSSHASLLLAEARRLLARASNARLRLSISSHGQADAEMEEATSSPNTQHRDSSASIATSISSGDLLQLVVDRFRAFAHLCHDFKQPSTALVDQLKSSVPEVIRDFIPVFHPQRMYSQRAHSTEENLAVLALASTLSGDAEIREEGYRLVCYLYGVVVLSYKHSMHLGGKSSPTLNCLMLIGKHGLRQSNPEFYLRFEESYGHILQDLARLETRQIRRDEAMDRLDVDQIKGMPDEELCLTWTRWYEHESRKRTLLLCAISDSQASSYFSPFNIDLAAHPESPRCQFLFAHVSEPCPGRVFFSWPPKEWAARLACSTSVPSSECADSTHRDGRPCSIAAHLADRLLRPHTAHATRPQLYPRFRTSFDFGPSNHASFKAKPLRPNGEASATRTPNTMPAPIIEVDHASSVSDSSSRRESISEGDAKEQDKREPRMVSQLYTLALLESIHGAWMSDTGWCQTAAWGASALPERLVIDEDDFDMASASMADLPGWRIGRTLKATQVAHALMNWSEIFGGWNDVSQADSDNAAPRVELSLNDDAQQATIRWQAIFLGLCSPLPTLCFFLQDASRLDAKDRQRHGKVSALLGKWVHSTQCRRALMHASTILTMLLATEQLSDHATIRPTTAHAAFMSLVVVVCAYKLLQADASESSSASKMDDAQREELVPMRQVWPKVLTSLARSDKPMPAPACVDPKGSQREGDDDWLWVSYWHRKFQHLGLAGIFREAEGGLGGYADWRMSVSGPSNGGGFVARGAAHTRPRWSSFVGDGRWPTSTRDNTSGPAAEAFSSQRRASHAQPDPAHPDPDGDLLRRHFRRLSAVPNPMAETRRWVLAGSTHGATFCGLALSPAGKRVEGQGSESGEKRGEAIEHLTRDHLREVVTRIQSAKLAWCFSHEFASLLHGALGPSSPGDSEHSHTSPPSESSPQ
ncbi:uncharacterized protein PAN0_004d2464 [Moesziomyces antarcticus]|uniref:Related to Cys(2)His(2) zinc finger transcriptional activator n=2 Tax=Pseudozyma antarctica TaxID=84753 RepID=A0A5C3FM49_PSEA2|nr:uncharacterized protein PAN0_004d2464 [Moesziomyces antarcticus]GAK64253.1 conserved hypothetical protein [Moesziomyces antarcticus]SPO44519.1 related to Cys(2)His(2) zinc finger transcriptional activator [Moesziomyces antarcticus]